MLHMYGIPNCQTVKKARLWLEEQGLEYQFHNFKTEAPTPSLLDNWLHQLPLAQLINKRGTTWRQLTQIEQAALQQNASAIPVLLTRPSLIKRPVLVRHDATIILGFDAEHYAHTLLTQA